MASKILERLLGGTSSKQKEEEIHQYVHKNTDHW